MLLYGICHLAYIPIRREPSHASEMVSQLIFGERYSILESNTTQTWYKIEIQQDNYQGWIHYYNLHALSQEEWLKHDHSKVFLTTQVVTTLKIKNYRLQIPLGSCIYQDDNRYFVGRLVFDTAALGDKRLPYQSLSYFAKKLLSIPYLWGGKTVWGFDCSGFTQILYRLQGVNLPRDAWQQAQQGVTVDFENRSYGDLAFFTNEEGKVTHVGFLLNKKLICHASGEVRIDSYDEKGIFRKTINAYSHQNISLKRVLL